MGVFFNPSTDGFERILRSHWRDKSELISFVAARLETPSRFLCLTRPRRFGKSSACQMLSAYFSQGADARALFRDRAVAQAGGAWDARLNQCDVLALDMTGLACRLQEADPLARFERSALLELQQAFSAALPAVTLTDGLHRVHEATGRTFLLLVDEWDIVFREMPAGAPVRRQYEAWLRSLLEGPAAQALSGAYMTGILPMRLSGVGLPSVRESSVTRPAQRLRDRSLVTRGRHDVVLSRQGAGALGGDGKRRHWEGMARDKAGPSGHCGGAGGGRNDALS